MKDDATSRGLGSQKNWFLYQVGRYRYRKWVVLPNLCCCCGIVEVFIFYICCFKIRSDHVAKEFLVVCIGYAKRVEFVKHCFRDLINVFMENVPKSFLASCQMPHQAVSLMEKVVTPWATIGFKKPLIMDTKQF